VNWLYIIILSVGCASESAPPVDACAPVEVAVDTRTQAMLTLDAGVWVQVQSSDREGAWTGFRIRDDGAMERKVDDGEWSASGRFSPDDLAAVRAVLDTAPSTPGLHRAGGPGADDATQHLVQLASDQGVVAWLATRPCKHDPADALVRALAPLLSKAVVE